MISKAGFTILVCLIPGLMAAQNLSSGFRVFEDDEQISTPDSIQTKISQEQTPAETILLQWLAADGFLNATVDRIDDDMAEITRNCAFELSELQISYSGEIDTVEVVKPEVRYTQQTLQNEIKSLLFGLARRGYPFAKADISVFSPDYEAFSISFGLEIDSGQKATSSEIYFRGASTNSQEYLRRISRFSQGELITPNYLRFLRNNLNASELFNFVGEGQIFLQKKQPVIVYEVDERSMNQFDGVLGYVPDASGSGQIVGDAELSLWNVLAQGNGLNFNYERLRPETSELEAEVSQDWIGDIPVGVTAGFQLYQNDTTYQARNVFLDGFYRLSGGYKLTAGIGAEATTSGDNIPTVVEPNARKRVARLGFEYSSLNHFDVPTSGYKIILNYSAAQKNLQDDSAGAFVQNSLFLQAESYLSVLKQSVIAVSLNGFLLEADKVTINDLKRFGGAKSLRGYAEDQFRAGQMLWGDLEYRFLVDQSSYLFAFAAAGRYHRPRLLTETNNDFRTTETLYSTGFGLSYQTRIGRLTFSYAISPEQSLANGKVHFGIRTEL